MSIFYDGDKLCGINSAAPANSEQESTIAAYMRQLKAALLDWQIQEHNCDGTHRRFYAQDTGAVNTMEAFLVMPSLADLGLYEGLYVFLNPALTCTGATTFELKYKINENTSAISLGIQDVKKFATNDLVAGDYLKNGIVVLVYDGTNWQLVNALVATTTPVSDFNGIVTYPEAKLVSVYNTYTSTTDAVVYTVPNNRRAIFQGIAAHGSAHARITIAPVNANSYTLPRLSFINSGANYFQNVGTPVVTPTEGFNQTQESYAGVSASGNSCFLMEKDDNIKVSTNGGTSTIQIRILEFSTTAKISSKRLTFGGAAGEYVLYKVPTGKSAAITSLRGSIFDGTSGYIYFSHDGGTSNFQLHLLKDGQATDGVNTEIFFTSLSGTGIGIIPLSILMNAKDSLVAVTNNTVNYISYLPILEV